METTCALIVCYFLIIWTISYFTNLFSHVLHETEIPREEGLWGWEWGGGSPCEGAEEDLSGGGDPGLQCQTPGWVLLRQPENQQT